MKSKIIFTLSITVMLSISITSISAEPLIPEWIRNNAAWWAEGIISDSDFVKGIEFLVNSGIISVKQTTQTQVDSPSLEIDVGPSDDSVEIIQETWRCSGNALCFTGIITSVIDGDTIKIDGKSIRFAMASAPELNELGGIESRNFIETICPVGSIATVDEDDGQAQGSYGRILRVVYCNGINLNADLLDVGHGYLISDFCEYSESENEYWTQKHGCSTNSEPQCPVSHPYLWSDGLCHNIPEPVYEEPVEPELQCDPSYPDFCIPPYFSPKDLKKVLRFLFIEHAIIKNQF